MIIKLKVKNLAQSFKEGSKYVINKSPDENIKDKNYT